MKKLTPYLQPALFISFIILGIFIGKFTGGVMTGSGIMLLLFVTLGKILFKKTERRMNAAMGMSSVMRKKS